jgi:hypothetical protein
MTRREKKSTERKLDEDRNISCHTNMQYQYKHRTFKIHQIFEIVQLF